MINGDLRRVEIAECGILAQVRQASSSISSACNVDVMVEARAIEQGFHLDLQSRVYCEALQRVGEGTDAHDNLDQLFSISMMLPVTSTHPQGYTQVARECCSPVRASLESSVPPMSHHPSRGSTCMQTLVSASPKSLYL